MFLFRLFFLCLFLWLFFFFNTLFNSFQTQSSGVFWNLPYMVFFHYIFKIEYCKIWKPFCHSSTYKSLLYFWIELTVIVWLIILFFYQIFKNSFRNVLWEHTISGLSMPIRLFSNSSDKPPTFCTATFIEQFTDTNKIK